MDLIQIKEDMDRIDSALEKGRIKLYEIADWVAKSKAEYEKALAIKIVEIRNRPIQLEGQEVDAAKYPGNLQERLARGACSKQMYEKEKAEGTYKAAVSGQETLRSRLNGKQSGLRYFE